MIHASHPISQPVQNVIIPHPSAPTTPAATPANTDPRFFMRASSGDRPRVSIPNVTRGPRTAARYADRSPIEHAPPRPTGNPHPPGFRPAMSRLTM